MIFQLKPVAAEPKRTVRKINRDKSPTPVPPANAAAAAAAAAPEKTAAATGGQRNSRISASM